MTKFFQSRPGPVLNSCIRRERDVIATCLHLLGYWPSNSLALMTVDTQGIGPLIRVDIAHSAEVCTDDYLDILFSSIPGSENSEQSDRKVFVLVFGDCRSNCLEIVASLPGQPMAENDQKLLRFARSCMMSLHKVSSHYSLEVLDVIVTGQSIYWSLHPDTGELEPAGSIHDVFSSPIYVELVAQGSVVLESAREACETRERNLLENINAGAPESWLALSEIATKTYIESRQAHESLVTFQIEAELEVWNHVIGLVSTLLEAEGDKHPATEALGDQICQLLPPDAAGYLVASLDSSVTLHYLVYLACTNIGSTLEALHQLGLHMQSSLVDSSPNYHRLLPQKETLSIFGLGELKQRQPSNNISPECSNQSGVLFANVLCGVASTPPDWLRLEALDCLCVLLENIAGQQAQTMLTVAQAWVRWFRGNSTAAAYLLKDANQCYFQSSPILLTRLLESSTIPLWLLQPGGLPPSK